MFNILNLVKQGHRIIDKRFQQQGGNKEVNNPFYGLYIMQENDKFQYMEYIAYMGRIN